MALPETGSLNETGEPEAQVLLPVKETLRAHLRKAETFELVGSVIVITNRVTPKLPPLLTKKSLLTLLLIGVLRVTPVTEYVCTVVANIRTAPELRVRVLLVLAEAAP